MKLLTTSPLRYSTVKLIGRLLQPLADGGLLTIPELNEIMVNLRHVASKGAVAPDVIPKLLDRDAVCEMLGIGLSNFKHLEKDGAFPFKPRKIGASLRYLNTDIINYILTLEVDSE